MVVPTFFANIGHHCCSYPGCQLALVIDENQKNRRAVCMASEAGYIEYPSLRKLGGCINSPAYVSRFRLQHFPRLCIAKPRYLSEDDLEGSDVDKLHHRTSEDGEPVIHLLLEKTTRSGTYYKVNLSMLPNCWRKYIISSQPTRVCRR